MEGLDLKGIRFGKHHPPFNDKRVVMALKLAEDVERAKFLLAQAGFPNGFKAELKVADAFLEKVNGFLPIWKEIGVDLVLKT